jgi:Uma2 family endonuclease
MRRRRGEAVRAGRGTLKREDVERAAEPDECYVLGITKVRPDLAIEVEWTRGGLNKLRLYAELGVPELWIHTRSLEIQVHRLQGEVYQRVESSELIPRLDVRWLTSFLRERSQTQAIRALRAAMRSSSPS